MVSTTTSWWILTDIVATSEFLLEAFDILGRRSLLPAQIDALPVPGTDGVYAGVSGAREFFILLRVDSSVHVENRRLRSVSVTVGDAFTVYDANSGATVSERFAVVCLRQGHEDLLNSYAIIAATLLAASSSTPTAREVTDLLDSLASLLAQSRAVNQAAVTGLWGELWTISNSPDPQFFASCWHLDPKDRYDFSFPQTRLEVKTTLGKSRSHEFSLEQLQQDAAKTSWVGSLQVVRDPSGQSVLDLVQAILGRVSPTTGEKVTRLTLETVSGDLESAQDFCFAAIGREPFHVFKADGVPRVDVPVGAGISAVRFTVDLGRLEPDFRDIGPTAAAMRP